jgi:hypothetical protein
MRIVQRIGDVDRDPHRLAYAELRHPIELVAERLALDEGHDGIEEAIRGP